MAEILAVESLCGGVVGWVGSSPLLGHSHVTLGCDNLLFVEVNMTELSSVSSIDWKMLTSVRPNNKIDEQFFAK